METLRRSVPFAAELDIVSWQKGSSMSTWDRTHVINLNRALAGIPAGERSTSVLQRGSLDVSLGTPARPNEQMPHEQDEVYVAIRGRGVLFHDGKRDQFESGDLLFVAAATEHWFEDFSEDLLVWRVFYGPAGGEVARDLGSGTA